MNCKTIVLIFATFALGRCLHAETATDDFDATDAVVGMSTNGLQTP